MNKPEWMPENPCKGCEKQTIAQMESSFTLDGKCVCLVLAEYTQKLAAQTELLEYLIKYGNKQQELHRVSFECGPIHKTFLESMLKEIQEVTQ
jgi:hypothetical protein